MVAEQLFTAALVLKYAIESHPIRPRERYESLASAIKRVGEMRDNVEGDSLNTERYVKELQQDAMKVTKARQQV